MARRKITTIERALVIATILLLLIVPVGRYAWGLIGFHIPYSEGDRVGQVVKLSNKGLIWKTWEGGMGLTQSGAYVEYWDFSIDAHNPNANDLVASLQRAYSTGELVKVHYKQRFGVLPWRGKTSYLIESVEFIREHNIDSDNSQVIDSRDRQQ